MFESDTRQQWPVRGNISINGTWKDSFFQACDKKSGNWIRHNSVKEAANFKIPNIKIDKKHRPRQGINTCGINKIMLFEKCGNESNMWLNGEGKKVNIDQRVMYPLITGKKFGYNSRINKWALILHNTDTGKPMTLNEIKKYAGAEKYITKYQKELKGRKGILIRSHIDKGFWWALLGVGKYSFCKYKVAWESLGKKEFTPIIIKGHYQANQSLHAFCPCDSYSEAIKIHNFLIDSSVSDWLNMSGMAGTCNWAQPGRIMKIMTLK